MGDIPISDIPVFVLLAIGIAYSIAVLIPLEKFKHRAMRDRQIHTAELRTTLIKMLKRTALAWIGMVIPFIGFALVPASVSSEGLVGAWLFCAFGLMFYAFVALTSLLALLWGTFRLPFVSGSPRTEAEPSRRIPDDPGASTHRN